MQWLHDICLEWTVTNFHLKRAVRVNFWGKLPYFLQLCCSYPFEMCYSCQQIVISLLDTILSFNCVVMVFDMNIVCISQTTLGRVTIQIDKVVSEGTYSGEFSLRHDSNKDGSSRTIEIEITWSNRLSDETVWKKLNHPHMTKHKIAPEKLFNHVLEKLLYCNLSWCKWMFAGQ